MSSENIVIVWVILLVIWFLTADDTKSYFWICLLTWIPFAIVMLADRFFPVTFSFKYLLEASIETGSVGTVGGFFGLIDQLSIAFADDMETFFAFMWATFLNADLESILYYGFVGILIFLVLRVPFMIIDWYESARNEKQRKKEKR